MVNTGNGDRLAVNAPTAGAGGSDLYTVVCASRSIDMEGLTPATYPVHVVARSPAAAMKQAEVMGHVARAAFCRGEKGRAKPATAVERLLGWRPAAECAHCGYLLDGLIIKDGSVSCPECGSHVKLWTRRAHSLFRREQ